MLHNVQWNGFSQDAHTFLAQVDIRITVGFSGYLNGEQSKAFQQSTLKQVFQTLNSKSSALDNLYFPET